MKKSLLTLSLVFVLAFSVGSAQAAPIEKWDYSVSGYFMDFTSVGVNGALWGTGDTTNYNGTTAYKGLIWGDPAPGGSVSSVALTSYDSNGNYMYTDNGLYDAMTMTHNNQTLDVNPVFLSTTKILINLSLSDPDSDFSLDFNMVWDVDFFETNNYYSFGDPRNNDIFVVTNISATYKTFEHNGEFYEVSFADPLNISAGQNLFTALPDWAQAYVIANGLSADETHYGFVTNEWATTDIITKVRIDNIPMPTPEPTSALLMGAGVAALGFLGRRRFSK